MPAARVCVSCAIVLAASSAYSQSLRGVVTDPSGAVVPDASVQLRGPSDRRVRTKQTGEYTFPALQAGTYEVRVTAKGFATLVRRGLAIDRAATFDARLILRGEKQTVQVDDEAGMVGVEPEANGGVLLMRGRQIAALSDDPDELAVQLQALAGPAPGPDGGQMFVDGFSGASLPPKSSIREIRINANPFSPEYDRPGFSRVEVFTKPGSEAFHAQAFTQFNDRALNSRNPLLAQPTMPPYRVRFYGIDLGGPVRRGRASFTLSAEHRRIGENALIQATTPEGRISICVAAPQGRTSITPRFDLTAGRRHNLSLRYQDIRSNYENQGVGDYNLPSRAYHERQFERVVQISETATISPRAMHETRLQFLKTETRYQPGESGPAIEVLGAFGSGGAPVGESRSETAGWEVTQLSTLTRAGHTWKWGGRARYSTTEDDSRNNFAGTFLFYNLDQYRAGQPAQFLMNRGAVEQRVTQFDFGIFATHDWRMQPNVTLSLGVRYEAQTNLGGRRDWAPRVGIAWRLNAKTVVRAGSGIFYERLAPLLTLNSRRYDGITQQSFVVRTPAFYPDIPPLDAGPQVLRPIFDGIAAPRLFQASIAIERQIDRASRVSLAWIASRGRRLLNTRNVNTPIGGLYPFDDSSQRLLTESAGMSSIQQLIANASLTSGKSMVFGYYALSYGKDNNEGLPADPYDLRAEWGPSSYAGVRHRLAFGGTLPLPLRISVSPFAAVNSGVPYNITTGLDPMGTGYPTARPLGLGRNSAVGPANANLGLRVSRTWAFGGEASTSSRGGHGATTRGITVGASTLNALNHPNFTPPVGNLSSPYFGQPRSLGGLVVMSHGGAPTTFNRKIDLQLRVTF
jgi:hypothetical protein